MEKFRILIADDLYQSREDFINFWDLYFSSKYVAEIVECETAEETINILRKSALDHNYFDIVVSDVDFTENQITESNIAGLEVIKKAKEVNFKTQVIWYSAQKELDLLRFRTEDWLRKNGYIDFSIRKAFLSDLFKDTMVNCIEAVRKNRTNLVVFLSKLFDTFNYGDDPAHDLGFYKLTHSNYKHSEMLSLLPSLKSYFEKSDERQFLDNVSINLINKYLTNLETVYPDPSEMEKFKAAFRLDLSDEILKSCQEPLIAKNIVINNIFQSKVIPRIYCERDRILTGLKTIYENIAKHNFSNHVENPEVTTTLESNGSIISIVISANGNSFDPKETFTNNRTAGVTTIHEIFNKYFDVIYVGKGISFNIYSLASEPAPESSGIEIHITIPLPTLTASGGGIEIV